MRILNKIYHIFTSKFLKNLQIKICPFLFYSKPVNSFLLKNLHYGQLKHNVVFGIANKKIYKTGTSIFWKN